MIGRVAALIALVVAVLAVVVLLGGGEEYEVTAEFENAGQLVKGNEVVVGGTSAGSVKSIELGPEGQALVTFTVDEDYAPLRRGTVATVRSPSLSQIAGRQIQLTLPVDSQGGDEIDDGGELSQEETVSAVDLDQLFNTLDPDTIKDFKHVIQGLEISYDGVGQQANRGLKYLNPFLSTSRRVFAEINSDQRAFENLIVDSSQLSGALAARAPDISALVGNLNRMMNAIGDRRERLAQAISLLPDFMRNANTTFVNLRAALDDVDPAGRRVAAGRPRAAPVPRRAAHRRRRRGADDPRPRRDRQALRRRQRPGRAHPPPGRRSPTRAIGSGSPRLRPRARATPQTCRAPPTTTSPRAPSARPSARSTTALLNLSFFRAYTPELVGWFDDFGHSGYIDAISGIGRISTSVNAVQPLRPRAACPTCSTR